MFDSFLPIIISSWKKNTCLKFNFITRWNISIYIYTYGIAVSNITISRNVPWQYNFPSIGWHDFTFSFIPLIAVVTLIPHTFHHHRCSYRGIMAFHSRISRATICTIGTADRFLSTIVNARNKISRRETYFFNILFLLPPR